MRNLFHSVFILLMAAVILIISEKRFYLFLSVRGTYSALYSYYVILIISQKDFIYFCLYAECIPVCILTLLFLSFLKKILFISLCTRNVLLCILTLLFLSFLKKILIISLCTRNLFRSVFLLCYSYHFWKRFYLFLSVRGTYSALYSSSVILIISDKDFIYFSLYAERIPLCILTLLFLSFQTNILFISLCTRNVFRSVFLLCYSCHFWKRFYLFLSVRGTYSALYSYSVILIISEKRFYLFLSVRGTYSDLYSYSVILIISEKRFYLFLPVRGMYSALYLFCW
jgi:hypothetical protein